MAFILTDTNTNLAKQINKNTQIIIQIEGLETVFGAQPILEFARWDNGLYWDDGSTRWDGLVPKGKSLAVIDLNKGTQKDLTQQIYPDKGSASSVSSMNVRLVDLNNSVAQLLSFDNIDEILGKKADMYIGFKQGAFPEDSIPVYRGIISDFSTANGSVNITVAHPDQLKRQDIYEQYQTELTSPVRYKAREIQDLYFEQRIKTDDTVEIRYISGSHITVSTVLNLITVTVDATADAKEVKKAIESQSDANAMVQVTISGDGDNLQTPFSTVELVTDTTIDVISTETLILSEDTLTSYIKIADEIMLVVGKTDTTIDVVRGQFGTYPENYDGVTDIASQYRLKDKPLDMALKLMLSSEENEYFISDDKPREIIDNRMIFDYFDIEDLTGLVEGDFFQLDGMNAGEYTIKEFGILDNGSYIEPNENLSDDPEFTDSFSYKSQYAVLPDGLGMLPFQVDVNGHKDIERFNPTLFVEYELDLKETLSDCKKLIEEQIYFPQGLYAIPRKARSSVKQVNPPLTSEVLPTLNTKNISNLTGISQRRSLHKYMYNIYRVDYELDEVEDKFKKKEILVNNNSKSRIKRGNKVMKIESKGLRNTAETLSSIESILRRYKDRYSFAPTYFEGIQITYEAGFNMEVGDVLPFGGLDTKVVNLQTGKRDQPVDLFEIINKSLNVKTGVVSIDLLKTSFNINARYAVFSLASDIGANNTTTSIEIKLSYDTGEYNKESDKWIPYIFQNIRIRSDDYVYDEEVQLLGVDPQNSSILLIEELSFIPQEGYFIEIPKYSNSDPLVNSTYKLKFSHMTFKGEISGVTSQSIFDVSDITGIFVGSEITVNSPDFQRDSLGDTYKIDDITGSTITLDKDLPFTPIIGDLVQNSNYGDGGYPYQLI